MGLSPVQVETYVSGDNAQDSIGSDPATNLAR